MKNYGEIFKSIRNSKELTLRQVEAGTGIKICNLSRWERNEVLPNISFCETLADFYGITVDELIGHESYYTESTKNLTNNGIIQNGGKMKNVKIKH